MYYSPAINRIFTSVDLSAYTVICILMLVYSISMLDLFSNHSFGNVSQYVPLCTTTVMLSDKYLAIF